MQPRFLLSATSHGGCDVCPSPHVRRITGLSTLDFNGFREFPLRKQHAAHPAPRRKIPDFLYLFSSMRTVFVVQTVLGDAQALDRLPAHDVTFDDLVDVFGTVDGVPHRFGIDDDCGTVFTLVKAAGLVGADRAL